jgi:uncharacterized protein (DUF2164 family)
MKYYDNQGTREAIDRYLKRNATRQANLGIDSTKEEIEEAAKAWTNDLIEIAKLDNEFAYQVHVELDE